MSMNQGKASSFVLTSPQRKPMSTKSQQRKAISDLERILPSGTVVRAYGGGRAQSRMTHSAVVILVIFAILFIGVAVTTGRLLFPGFLLIILFVSAVMPLRGIAVTDTGIFLLSRSAWNSRPKQVLAVLPPSSLAPTNVKKSGRGAVRVTLGTDIIRLRIKDFEPIASVAGSMAVEPARAPEMHAAYASSYGTTHQGPAPVAAPPGWYPVGNDQYRQAYWDGRSWTAPKRWDGVEWIDA
jgi:hypothetical protein